MTLIGLITQEELEDQRRAEELKERARQWHFRDWQPETD